MLMPVLFGGAILVQRVVDRQSNGIERRVAVIDGTGQLFEPLERAAAIWNEGDRDGGKKVVDGPLFALERVARTGRYARPTRSCSSRSACAPARSSRSWSCRRACWAPEAT